MPAVPRPMDVSQGAHVCICVCVCVVSVGACRVPTLASSLLVLRVRGPHPCLPGCSTVPCFALLLLVLRPLRCSSERRGLHGAGHSGGRHSSWEVTCPCTCASWSLGEAGGGGDVRPGSHGSSANLPRAWSCSLWRRFLTWAGRRVLSDGNPTHLAESRELREGTARVPRTRCCAPGHRAKPGGPTAA